ncbi:RDD family protein [Pseudorhodoferax sp.]|uniref:RDD family protein n=1 Tax=Pseudorhodoferax sp. TaxID=1993553 RepID=UPI0039E3AEEB
MSDTRGPAGPGGRPAGRPARHAPAAPPKWRPRREPERMAALLYSPAHSSQGKSMDQAWWYGRDQEQRGPFSTAQMQALLREGVIGPATPIARSAGPDPAAEWVPLHAVADFAAPPERACAADPARLDGGPGPATPFAAAESAPPLAAPTLPLAGPWRRFFARGADLLLFSVVGGYVMHTVAEWASPAFAMWLRSPNAGPVLGVFVLPFALALEAVVAGLFGTTPAKKLLGLQVATLAGARPTFEQHLRRLFGLYWSALAMGVPLVNLFTMWRQYRHLKAGRATGYDRGAFQVHALPLGRLRMTGAVAVVAAAFFTQQVLMQQIRADRRDYNAGFSWRNPVSGASAAIPPGWLYAEQKNDTGDSVYTFSSDKIGVVAIFAMEEGMGHLTLQEYQSIWAAAVQPDMLMDERVVAAAVHGRETLQVHGAMARNATRRVHATLFKSGDQIWRLVLVALPGREPDGTLSRHLREALVDTVPERPDPAAAPSGPAAQPI